jgi:catechol 2,3-dioxygenase-like lactoylglutathione lyase family enzyme
MLPEAIMSRIQLALNVSDLDEAVRFYSKLFSSVPAKVMPGYANFAIADPPLKLVLIESTTVRSDGTAGALNHLGVEVDAAAEVTDAASRLADDGLLLETQLSTTCCYAVQDKVWTSDPDGAPWEIYTVLADAPSSSGPTGGEGCCASDPKAGSRSLDAAPLSGCC